MIFNFNFVWPSTFSTSYVVPTKLILTSFGRNWGCISEVRKDESSVKSNISKFDWQFRVEKTESIVSYLPKDFKMQRMNKLWKN